MFLLSLLKRHSLLTSILFITKCLATSPWTWHCRLFQVVGRQVFSAGWAAQPAILEQLQGIPSSAVPYSRAECRRVQRVDSGSTCKVLSLSCQQIYFGIGVACVNTWGERFAISLQFILFLSLSFPAPAFLVTISPLFAPLLLSALLLLLWFPFAG